MGPMMPPPPPPPSQLMRQRMIKGARRMQDVFPRWLSLYPIVTYILALALVSLMYLAYAMPWYYVLAGVVSVAVFFYYGNYLAERLSLLRMRKVRSYERRIFLIALILRVLWMFLILYLFIENYDNAFGFENSDAIFYDEIGQFVAVLIDNGNFHFYDEISQFSGHDDIADMGYGVYVGAIYWLTGSEGVETAQGIRGVISSVIILRLLKCILSAWTVVLIYRLTKRNFDAQTARIAAIFCALWPNFWYYCGCHLKETEMVFLCVLFVEQADQMLRSKQFTAWKVVPVLLIGAALFTFRTPLALVAFLSLVFSVVMSSTKVVSWRKRIIVGGLAVALVTITMGNMLQEKAQELYEIAQSDEQEKNMQWRANDRENANSFAKYAGKSVFAPMIFTIPFPTMVKPFEGQDVQQLLNGGNYIKNILSGFTIFALVMLLMTGRWREKLLPLSFVLGYTVVLAFSSFAQSERFHQPVMPLEFMFAAYGLSIAVTKPKYKRWFMYWCILMIIGCIAWNWFKLAGRGLI